MSAPPPPKPSELIAEIDCPCLMDEAIERVKIRVEWGDITSQIGNELITQPVAKVVLDTTEMRLKIPLGEQPVPRFSASYLQSFDHGEVDLEIYFVLKERTATEAVYVVHDSDPEELQRGLMAQSSPTLSSRRQIRRLFG